MPKTKLEAKQWLKDVGFSDAEIADLAAKFTADQMGKIAEGYMRQSDYDAMMNAGKAELEKAQADLAAANTRLNEEMADFARVQAAGGQVTAQMRRDLDAAQQRALKLEQRVRGIATDAGIDPTKALEGLDGGTPPPVATAPVAPPIDPSKYASADDVRTAYQDVLNLSLTWPAELTVLAQEHQQLFGKPLDPRDIVKELQTRAATPRNQKSLNPRDIWNEKYGVETKRAEVQQAKYDADIKAAEERGRQAAYSESAIPGQASAPGRHSPIFSGSNANRQSALSRPQPGTRTQRAVQAFASGKYRQDAGREKTSA